MASAPNKRKNIHKSQVYISVWFQLIAKNNSLNFGRWCLYNNNRTESHHQRRTSLFVYFCFLIAFAFSTEVDILYQVEIFYQLIFCIKSRFFINWYFVSSRDFLSIDILYQVENRYFGLITFFSKYLVLNSDSSI